MENAIAIAAILGPIYLVLGLSVLFYVDAWLEMMREWNKNHYLLVVAGWMGMGLGLLVINLYNVWQWNLWLIVTVTGWMAFLKAVFYFLAPGNWSKACFKACANTNWLYFSSLVMIVAGAALSYYVYVA